MKLPGFFRHQQLDSGDFWAWFVANELAIRSDTTGQSPIMAKLLERLRAVHPGLQWEMSVNETGDREFIVSAGGVRDVIPAVEALVAKAPAMPGWKIIGFRQRKENQGLSMGGKEFGANDVWFKAEPHREHVDLDLYVKGFDGVDELPYHIGFLFLDVTLGEYDVVTKVGRIDFHALPDDPSAKGLRPIAELAPIVDAL